jgi:hypothetical protein
LFISVLVREVSGFARIACALFLRRPMDDLFCSCACALRRCCSLLVAAAILAKWRSGLGGIAWHIYTAENEWMDVGLYLLLDGQMEWWGLGWACWALNLSLL